MGFEGFLGGAFSYDDGGDVVEGGPNTDIWSAGSFYNGAMVLDDENCGRCTITDSSLVSGDGCSAAQ